MKLLISILVRWHLIFEYASLSLLPRRFLRHECTEFKLRMTLKFTVSAPFFSCVSEWRKLRRNHLSLPTKVFGGYSTGLVGFNKNSIFFSHGREINKKLNVRKWDFKGRLCREGLRTSQRNTHNKKGSQQQLLDQQMYTFQNKGAQYILVESFWIPCVPCVPGPDWECAHSYRYRVA